MASDAVRPVKLAVTGAGLIGRRHIDGVLAEPEAELVAIVDPSDAAREFAVDKGVSWYPDFASMFRTETPDGAIIASPNQMHVANGLECITMGIPILVEKPIADDTAGAGKLVDAAEHADVPLLVGHHRRHNPLIQRAKKAIDDGRLGQIVSIQGTCWFFKPDEYFEAHWRREKGAGPVFLNLIHDVDLLRYLCGDVVAVQAMESNALRGNAVEETAVILLRFASGALGTINVSDTIAAPWSWELTSGENPAYAHTQEACYWVGGTRGSLTVPYLDLWYHTSTPSWWEPIDHERLPVVAPADPLALQIKNLCGVVRGEESPVVSGREGLKTLTVIAAVKEAAVSGQVVTIS